MADNPCRGCTKRYPGCQDKCPDGIAWSKKEKARRDKIRAAKEKELAPIAAVIGLKENIKRK